MREDRDKLVDGHHIDIRLKEDFVYATVEQNKDWLFELPITSLERNQESFPGHKSERTPLQNLIQIKKGRHTDIVEG